MRGVRANAGMAAAGRKAQWIGEGGTALALSQPASLTAPWTPARALHAHSRYWARAAFIPPQAPLADTRPYRGGPSARTRLGDALALAGVVDRFGNLAGGFRVR